MHTALIFAGAGASKAVSPKQYPTTVEFLEGLSQTIRGHKLFVQVEEFLRETSGNKTLDIELILWRLQELQTFCTTVSDRAQFPGWLITSGRLLSALDRANENVGHLHGLSNLAIGVLDGLIGQINQTVYDLYSALPTPEDLSGNWTPLLQGCQLLDTKTEIVTTNYDMVIESALDKNPVADTGWRGSVLRTLDLDLWGQAPASASKGMLTKLQGLLNFKWVARHAD